MKEILLPCDKYDISLKLRERNLRGVLSLNPEHENQPLNQKGIIAQAMQSPIGSAGLDRLAGGCRSAVIICSDHTRPVPSKLLIPFMLDALRRANPEIDITLLIATGCHRGSTQQEIEAKFGEEIARNEHIVMHDCADDSMLATLGVLPSGAVLTVNRLAVETDLLLAEGFIEPHFFAGFSGGRKSVLPGISGRKTVLGNHCAGFINHPCARTGVLDGNPIHMDMLAAARMANLKFVLNVVLNARKEVVAAFAGDAIEAHAEGCRYVAENNAVEASPADIVVVTNGGYPLDQNLYQCVKGMTAAEATAAEGAVIVMAAGCADGIGGDDFYNQLKNAASPAQLLEELSRIPMDETMPDQWQSQILARVLSKFTVVLAGSHCSRSTVEDMKMLYAEDLDRAMDMARKIKGENASVTVIPDGVSVIVRH